MAKKMEYVTTDCDLWNSADELHFFVQKGQVKHLPEIISPVIEDGINQGLLREPTMTEMEMFEFDKGLEKAIKEKKIQAGKSYDETAGLYQAYLEAQEEEEKGNADVIAQPALEATPVQSADIEAGVHITSQTEEQKKEFEEKEKILKEREKELREKNKKLREKEKKFKEKKAKQA